MIRHFLFERLLGNRPLGFGLPGIVGRQWLMARLAIIAAIEHFTAVLGAWVLDDALKMLVGRDRPVFDDPLAHASGASFPSGHAMTSIAAYGAVVLSFVGNPDYAFLPALQSLGLPGECQTRVEELHESLIDPLRHALEESGYENASLRAHLAWGVLGAGSRRLSETTEDPTEIAEVTLDTFCRALR